MMSFPSVKTIWVNSSPTAFSSMMTFPPPTLFWKISSMYAMVSSTSFSWSPWTLTHFPPVSPTGLIATGYFTFLTYSMASVSLSKLANAMFPSMLYFWTRFLMKVLEVSILAAALVGEAHFTPTLARASTTPAARGASGPTNANSMKLLMAKSQILSMSDSSARRTFLASSSIPGLAFFITAYISAPPRARAHTAACSLAPPPIVKIFMLLT